jgi:sugar O-acyltransferase (sialic acid O-acetyltransferase NeuD family)
MAAHVTRIVVVGAGGHGLVVVDALQSQAAVGQSVQVVAVLDDAPALHGTLVGRFPVAGDRSTLASIPHDAVVVAIGDNATRRLVQGELEAEGEVVLIAAHPASVISSAATVDAGAVVCAGAVVGPAARIRTGAIVNTRASVDHHCDIGEFAHVAPGVTLAGGVSVGAEALVGMGAVVLPGVRIGARVTVGAGTVVLEDVADGMTIVGVPGRPLSRPVAVR